MELLSCEFLSTLRVYVLATWQKISYNNQSCVSNESEFSVNINIKYEKDKQYLSTHL